MSDFHIPNLKVDTITDPVVFSSTLTAPNAISVLSTQIANVQTNDIRYAGPDLKRLSNAPAYDSLGGWVQLASFYSGGVRGIAELFCILACTPQNLYVTFKLLFSFDPYGLSPDKDFPQCVSFRELGSGSPIESCRIRQSAPDPTSGVRTTYFDVKYKSSTSGVTSGTFANALLNVGSVLSDNNFLVSTASVVNPNTAGQLLSSEFYLANNSIVKTTTGDFLAAREGQMVINTASNTLKIYAEGAWRTITTWT